MKIIKFVNFEKRCGRLFRGEEVRQAQAVHGEQRGGQRVAQQDSGRRPGRLRQLHVVLLTRRFLHAVAAMESHGQRLRPAHRLHCSGGRSHRVHDEEGCGTEGLREYSAGSWGIVG